MRRKHLRIATLAAIAMFLAACSGHAVTAASGGSGSGSKTVVLGEVAFDESIASSDLWQVLLEKQGYTVNIQTVGDVGTLYAGVANGQLNVVTDTAPIIQANYWKTFSSKFTPIGKWYYPVVQAVAVPDYTGLTSMTQLASHAAEFNNQIVGIEPGSGLMQQMHGPAVTDYGLQKYNIIDGSTPAMLAALEKALTAKKPIAVTLWQPHWAFSKYPITLLKDPKLAFSPPDHLVVVGNKNWASANPKIAAEFSKFNMTSSQLQGLELMIDQAGTGNQVQAVKKWIQENQSVVNGWTSGTTG